MFIKNILNIRDTPTIFLFMISMNLHLSHITDDKAKIDHIFEFIGNIISTVTKILYVLVKQW